MEFLYLILPPHCSSAVMAAVDIPKDPRPDASSMEDYLVYPLCGEIMLLRGI